MSPARERSIEVTAEEAAAVAANNTPPTSARHITPTTPGSNSVKKKLTKFIMPMGKNLQLRSPRLHLSTSDFSSRNNQADADNASYNSESNGQMSVTPTVASLDTVKISNRQVQELLHVDASSSPKGKKTPWKKLKQFMGIPPSNTKKGSDNQSSGRSLSDAIAANGRLPLGRAQSTSADLASCDRSTTIMEGIGRRRRTSSTDISKAKNHAQSEIITKQQQQSMLDEAVRGRLDGMDLLYLGPAFLISLQRTNTESSSTPWEPASSYSFAGRSTHYTTKQIVKEMTTRSLGGDSPEIILEGFFRDDRWIVSVDTPIEAKLGVGGAVGKSILVEVDSRSGRASPEALPPLQLTDEEDHSHSTAPDEIPRHKLWGYMWGSETNPPPKPSHMTSVDDIDPDSDSILEMAASCSVPIDVDEDTFMIGNALHLQAVHDIASAPLQHGQFEEALEIFKRILRGIEIQENDALRHLEGVTLHNMAVVAMWQEDYVRALDWAGKAIKARIQYLPEGHPDIAVSLVRQGCAYFALERYDMAEASFHAALEKVVEDNVVRAKVLSNLGVAQYQRGDDAAALKNFTDALEIQRMWLRGPVKREATVFGAAVMLGNMGKIHIKRGDYDLAVSVYEESLLVSFHLSHVLTVLHGE